MKPVRLGVWGLGRIGAVHGKLFSQDPERYRLVAVCDQKPIAVTADDFRRLRKLDKTYKGRLIFLHNHRFEPAFETVQRIVASGVLGAIQLSWL